MSLVFTKLAALAEQDLLEKIAQERAQWGEQHPGLTGVGVEQGRAVGAQS